MRITNKMMSNNSMMNINGNKEYLDKLNTKMATEKKITRPSDDPIVAIRALRLRSNLSEVSQYYGANVPDAQAWVDVTQRSIDSSMEMISSMRALCNQGANGTNTVSEREKIYQDLEALKSQIYANGNTAYAGRTVFTGFRTDKKLTFTEDTEEDYRGIADRFNASDVVKNTYIEGAMSVADISSLGKNAGTVTTDLSNPANPTITIDGTAQTLTKNADGSYEPVTENGRTYTVAEDGTVSVTGADKTTYIVSSDGTVSEITNETGIKEDRVNRIRLSYDNINGTVMTGPTEGWNGAQIGGLTDWTDNYSYFFNEEGMLTKAGETYHPELPIDGGEMIFSFNEPYDSTFNTRSTLPGAEDYTRKSIISSGNPAEVKKTGNEIKITYPYFGSDMTTKLGDLACTITEYEPGKYSADNNASVKDNGDGTLTVTIPGPNGTKDVYTEITVKADGTAVDSAYKYQKIGEANYWFENGVLKLTGKVFANFAKDYTTLVYREELSQKASVPQSSVKTDPYDGLQSYVLDCGTQKYTIKKIQDEDRWFAYDSSDVIQKNIEVTQNTDRSFKIVVAGSGVEINRDSDEYECDVYNVSANAKAVTSSYHQTPLEVQITDSTATVASDSEGNGLTAYQYLALDDNDKNSDKVAANRIFLLADTGELVFGSDVADKLSSLKDIEGVDTISVKYDKSRFNSGDLRPEHYFECKELADGDTIVDPTRYDVYDQEIYYTVGTNQNIQINTHADEIFDTQIVRELDDILDAINDYNAAEEKVNRLKAMQEDTTTYDETNQAKITVMLEAAGKELDIAKNRLQKRYETGIGAFKDFYEQANEANTRCGTRDSRLTLISNRLMEQKTTVKTLASNNEDADITELAIDVQEAELVYNAALMSTGKINQRSLMDYI